MISESMKAIVKNNSVIREMFEEGKKLVKQYGKENVYDFSLGNPSVEPPVEVNEAIVEALNDKNIHAYMSNSGFEDVRSEIAHSLNSRFDAELNEQNIIMCVGAAGGLNVVLKSILNPDDEVIVLIPYFMEYRHYIANQNGKVIEVKCNKNFEPNMEDLESKISPRTKALIINTPNNPSGIVYSESVIKNLASILNKKAKEYNTSIYLLSDEPYREIVYDGTEILYLPKYYKNTLVVYSYSKSLSLPGERIGYIIVPSEADDFENLVQAVTISTRILGFVNAPSLLQKVIAKCVDKTADLSEYKKNRDILYNGLIEIGYECNKPQGAFYLFLKSPIEDEKEFCKMAKKYNILMVPGSSFACPGYVRLAYCTETEMIRNSLPKFKELKEEIDREGGKFE